MRHLSAAMALSFMASSTFAAIIVDFNENNNYKTESAKLEDDQDSWSSWTKENGVLKTTIKGDKFSSAIVVPPPECDAGYQKLVVSYTSNCGDGNNIAAYGYDSYFPTDPWYEIGSFKSGQEVNVQCEAFDKIALQAQTSSASECNVTVSSIFIGMQSELFVSGATVPNMSDYKKSGDSISLSIPFKARLDSIKPTFSGYFGSVSPSTAQDFTDGPITYTFTAKSGTETQTIVLSIAKLPGDSNAKASGVGFCKLAKTESGLTKAELIAKGNICTEGSEVVHPKASGDTGTITFNIYKWAPDSVKTRLYGRYDSQKRNAGVAKGNLASMAWYYKGEAMENVTDETPFDIENTVLKVTAEAGYPIFYYKLKLQGVDPKNFLYQIVMVDTVAKRFYYPRTIYDPESPKDTGSVIFDLPFKGTVASKLFVCGPSDDYNMFGVWSSCKRLSWVTDSSSISVSGKMSGEGGMYARVSKDYDKKLYAIKLKRQTEVWPLFSITDMVVWDNNSRDLHFSFISCLPGDKALQFRIPMNRKLKSSREDDYELYPIAMNPFFTYNYAFESDTYWDYANKITVTSVNEANQKRIVSVFSSWNEEKNLAELRHFFVQVGSARIPGKIDQEKKLVHVDVPFEMNFERTMISWGGPHRSYSENYVQDHFYDMRDTIEFDIHSADSSTKAIYKVTVAYNPDAFKPAPDTTAKDTTVKDTTKKDTTVKDSTKKEAIPLVMRNLDASVRLAGNTLMYLGDIAEVKRLFIYDALGHMVYARVGLESASMDVGFMNRGVYVVKVETSHGLVTERIVKRR